MSASISLVLEQVIEGLDPLRCTALGRVIEAHPALTPLLDFYSADPTQIALAVGMVSAHEEDGMDDLAELDLGAPEWFEPSVGLAAVRRALGAIRNDPQSITNALYDPSLRPTDVIADLEAIEQTLLQAQQHETRFHFAMEG